MSNQEPTTLPYVEDLEVEVIALRETVDQLQQEIEDQAREILLLEDQLKETRETQAKDVRLLLALIEVLEGLGLIERTKVVGSAVEQAVAEHRGGDATEMHVEEKLGGVGGSC